MKKFNNRIFICTFNENDENGETEKIWSQRTINVCAFLIGSGAVSLVLEGAKFVADVIEIVSKR